VLLNLNLNFFLTNQSKKTQKEKQYFEHSLDQRAHKVGQA